MSKNRSELELNLISLLNTIIKSWKTILLFVLGALILGAAYLYLFPKKYSATTKFIVRHPTLLDRNQILRQNFYNQKTVFADENTDDNIIGIFNSKAFHPSIKKAFNLSPNEANKIFSQLKIVRNETRDLELVVIDHNKERAIKLANSIRDTLEAIHTDIYKSYNTDIIEDLNSQVASMNKQVNLLSDSMQAIRTKYNIHSYLTPKRGKATIQHSEKMTLSNSGGVELLSRLAVEKDRISEDIATYKSLINEYSIGMNRESFNTFHILQSASIDNLQDYPKRKVYFLSVFLIALATSILFTLVRDRIAK